MLLNPPTHLKYCLHWIPAHIIVKPFRKCKVDMLAKETTETLIVRGNTTKGWRFGRGWPTFNISRCRRHFLTVVTWFRSCLSVQLVTLASRRHFKQSHKASYNVLSHDPSIIPSINTLLLLCNLQGHIYTAPLQKITSDLVMWSHTLFFNCRRIRGTERRRSTCCRLHRSLFKKEWPTMKELSRCIMEVQDRGTTG